LQLGAKGINPSRQQIWVLLAAAPKIHPQPKRSGLKTKGESAE